MTFWLTVYAVSVFVSFVFMIMLSICESALYDIEGRKSLSLIQLFAAIGLSLIPIFNLVAVVGFANFLGDNCMIWRSK